MKDTIKFLQRFLGEYKPELVRSLPFLVAGAAVSLLGMVPAFLQQKLFDTALPTGNLVLMAALLAGLVGVQVALSALEAGLNWNEALVLEQGDFRLRSRFLHHLLRLPQAYFDTHSPGRIQKIWEDCGRRTESLQALVFSAGRGILVLGLYLPVLLGLSPLLAGVRLLSFPAGWLINRWFGQRDRQKEQLLWDAGGRFQTELNESVLGIRTVKAFSAEQSVVRKLQRGLLILRRGSLERRRLQGLWGVVSQLSGQLSTALYLMVAAGALFSGHLSFGRFIAFGLLSATGLAALGSVVESWGRVGRNLNAHLRLDHHLDLDLETQGSRIEWDPVGPGNRKEDHEEVRLPDRGAVEFRGVVFGFRTGDPVLQGVSLCAEPGSKIAIVGPSGSGKSTLVNLLLGYYHPQKGQVLLDGLEVSQYDTGTLRRELGLVLQENYFFQKSLRENLLLGRRRSEWEIWEALRKAQALDFVQRLPGRLDAVYGEGGLGLSGGQKQRLAIARAFLQNPQVLVLDEPTSALDPGGERAVQIALEALTVGRTSLTIAHRLGTVVHSDRIYCLDKGRVVGQGSHGELMDTCGLYRNLWTSQRGVS